MAEPNEPIEFHRSSARVVEEGGEKRLQLDLPRGMEGHNFALVLQNENVPEPSAAERFRIEFQLGDEFQLFSEELCNSDLAQGVSCLSLPSSLSDKPFEIRYSAPEDPTLRVAELTLCTEGGVLRRIRLDIDEEDERVALTRSAQFVGPLLDQE